jgi:hypothetical protein
MPSSASDNLPALSVDTSASLPRGPRADRAQPDASNTTAGKSTNRNNVASPNTPLWLQQRELLLSVLRQPESLGELTLAEWDLLIRLARQIFHELPVLISSLRNTQNRIGSLSA